MTRLELANAVASILSADRDIHPRVWARNGIVRVYVKIDGGGKRGLRDRGYVEIHRDGTVEMNEELAYALHHSKDIANAIRSLPPAAPEEEAPAGKPVQSGNVGRPSGLSSDDDAYEQLREDAERDRYSPDRREQG